MKDATILFKFPSRSRPQKFRDAVKSITDNLARPDLAAFMFTLDDNDPKKSEYEIILNDFQFDFYAISGESKNKIHAVNRDLEIIDVKFPDWKIIVCMSDDMQFITKGFDDIIRNAFHEQDLCLHFPDQNQGANCMTLNITDRKYFERTKKIYHEDYISVECDLEEQEKAQMLGRYKFMEGVRIFNHNHPSFGQCEYDQQYNRTESFPVHEADKATRRRRKANNYDLFKTEKGWSSKEMDLVNIYQNEKEKELMDSILNSKTILINSFEEKETIKQRSISILEKALEEIKAL